MGRLVGNRNGVLWAGCHTCEALYAVGCSYWNRFWRVRVVWKVLQFEYVYGAYVNACSLAGTFLMVNNYFWEGITPLVDGCLIDFAPPNKFLRIAQSPARTW